MLPATLVAAAASCGGDQPGAAAAGGGTAVVCLAAQPAGLNPFTSPDAFTADFNPLLFTPLVRYDADSRIGPWLARAWDWNDAGTELTVHLRDDVRWHDGRPVTAEDVAWTIRAAADTAYAYWTAEDFFTVTSAEAVDSTTVVVRYAEPNGLGMEAFAALPILPAHLLADVPPAEFQRAAYHREPVGSGPFRFARRGAAGEIVLERFADFPEDMGRPHLDRLILRAIPEVSTQFVELRTGSVHACIAGSAAADEARQAGNIEIVPIPPSAVQVMPLRNDRAPFDDARVRRAISAALDRAELAQATSSVAQPAGNFLPPESPFRADSLGQLDGNATLANALLDSAGWTRSGDGIRTRNGEPLTFTIYGPQNYRNVVTAAQAQLRRVGIDAQLQLMEGASFFGLLQDPEQRPSAMVIGFVPTKIEYFDPYSELHSEGYSNLSSYDSEFVDSLISALRTTQDSLERRAIYTSLQRRVRDDVPAIYAVYIPRIFAVGPALEGVRMNAGGPFAFVTDWTIER